MTLIEAYDWLVRNNIIVEPDPDKIGVYDYARFTEFKKMLDHADDESEIVSDLKADLDDALDTISDLKDTIEELRDNL